MVIFMDKDMNSDENLADIVQKALDANPADPILREEECVYVQAFNEAKLDEERFLKQKAKVEWLEVADSNLAYFHKTLKSRNQSGRIWTNLNSENVEVSVPMSIAANMVRNVTNEEIKSAMFDIGDEKAPGPDGFTSVFFKKGWRLLGGDEFCNAGIKEVVSDNQSAFILGWRISDNILITQELMHTYHKKKGPPRCAFKIDIQKVYDTVDWRFLENILTRLDQVDLWMLLGVQTDFGIGELPVKYLGVPLISLRLLNRDCKVLVQKAINRIGDWKTSLYLLWDVFNYANCLFEGFYGAMVNLLEVRTKCHGMRFVFLNVKEVLASDVPVKSDMSWGWRKLLQLREVVKPFFWVKLGNGLSTSLWNNMILLTLAGDLNGNCHLFSVAKAWEAIRPRGNQVASVSDCLVTNGDLNALRCSLCDSQPDSHSRLFFDCVFSSKVWSYVRILV
ncbi:hypothetical protein Tco_1420131 [Tanacetum coccineum]